VRHRPADAHRGRCRVCRPNEDDAIRIDRASGDRFGAAMGEHHDWCADQHRFGQRQTAFLAQSGEHGGCRVAHGSQDLFTWLRTAKVCAFRNAKLAGKTFERLTLGAAADDVEMNGLRGVTQGWVTGTARPVHIGRTTQVWQIDMTNDEGQLTCVSRITMAVVEAK